MRGTERIQSSGTYPDTDFFRDPLDKALPLFTDEVLIYKHRVACGVRSGHLFPEEILARTPPPQRFRSNLKAIVRIEEDEVNPPETFEHLGEIMVSFSRRIA